MSGATFNSVPTHKLFGFRYITFSAANIHFTFEFTKKREIFSSAMFYSKKRAKKAIFYIKKHKKDLFIDQVDFYLTNYQYISILS